jgi:hypothetical protein
MVVFFGLDLSSEVVLSYHELVGWLKGYKWGVQWLLNY